MILIYYDIMKRPRPLGVMQVGAKGQAFTLTFDILFVKVIHFIKNEMDYSHKMQKIKNQPITNRYKALTQQKLKKKRSYIKEKP